MVEFEIVPVQGSQDAAAAIFAAEAVRRARAGAPEGTLIWAGSQRAAASISSCSGLPMVSFMASMG